MPKFNVGDVVRCVKGQYAHVQIDQELEVMEARAKGMYFKGVLEHAPRKHEYEYDNFELVKAFLPPAEDGIIRLRVLEGIGVLRKGTIVTVKKEHATTYLLNEHPGKLYKKDRFKRLVDAPKAIAKPRPNRFKVGDEVYISNPNKQWADGDWDIRRVDNEYWFENKTKLVIKQHHEKYDGQYYYLFEQEKRQSYLPHDSLDYYENIAAPVARELKAGDKVKCVNFKRATGPMVGGGNPWGSVGVNNLKEGFVLTVIEYLREYQDKGMCFRAKTHNKSRTYHWPLDAFTFEDGSPIVGGANVGTSYASAITQPVEPPKPVLKDIWQELDKCTGTTLNDWLCLHKDAKEYTPYFGKPCFAAFGYLNGPCERIVVAIKNSKKNDVQTLQPGDEEPFERWLDYVYNRSPFSVAFVKKDIPDVATLLQKGYELDTNKGVNINICAAIAIRDGYEHRNRLKVFTHFIDEGYSEHTAYLLAFCLMFDKESFVKAGMGNGHTNFDGNQEVEQLFKFFREGFHLKVALEQQPMKEVAQGYLVSKAIAEWPAKKESLSQFISNSVETVKTGEGWGAKETISLEAANKLASIIEQRINNK